jgi:ABC-2 type transport system ATP-binding protein
MLVFSRATKRFGSTVGVSDLSLQVSPGEIFGLLGPNGAGKTTAIKLAVGLLRPTSGSVQADGVDVGDPRAGLDQLLGYLPDEPALYPKLTGAEMLSLVASLRGTDPARAEALLRELGEPFGITAELLGRFTMTYSRGTRRKLSLLLALLHDPALLVLDEPTESLDPVAVRRLRELLLQKKAAGRTVLLSTNDLSTAESLCDRIGILNHGRLVYVGTREEVRAHQSNHPRDLETLFHDQVAGGSSEF